MKLNLKLIAEKGSKVAKLTRKSVILAKDKYSEAKHNRIQKEIQKCKKFDVAGGMYGNDIIFERLKMAKQSELMSIVNSLNIEDVSSSIPLAYLSKKYRQAAGHSMINIARGDHSLPYKRILIDVADKLNPGFKWTPYKMDDGISEIEIEEKILEFTTTRFKEYFNKLSPEKRKIAEEKFRAKLTEMGVKQSTVNTTMAALTSGVIGAAFAPTVGLMLWPYAVYQLSIGTIIIPAAAPTLGQAALAGTGVGIAIAAPLMALTLSGPAYRKTIPTTLNLIAIRKRYEGKMTSITPIHFKDG